MNALGVASGALLFTMQLKHFHIIYEYRGTYNDENMKNNSCTYHTNCLFNFSTNKLEAFNVLILHRTLTFCGNIENAYEIFPRVELFFLQYKS